MREQHTEKQRATLKWLPEWSEIKIKVKPKCRGQYVSKRHQIINTAEATVQAHSNPRGGDDGGCGEQH